MNQLKIVMLGAGNVAFHLSQALAGAGHIISQVYNRSEQAGIELAKLVNSTLVTKTELIDNKADLYIISVSDNAIKGLTERIEIKNKSIVHTAGSVDCSVLKKAKNHGVFYPLQTFSKNRKINFNEVPICIEANNENFQQLLYDLANQVSESVWKINSAQRKQLHLSAVFACNFVNHLYAISKELINNESIDYKILRPLIIETAIKATEMNPWIAQTGPALRNDTESLKKHIDLLSSWPEYQKIYKILSESIYLKNK